MSEAPPVTCEPPQPPSNGSVNIGNQSLPSARRTTVPTQCADGLFPTDIRITTCMVMAGMGEWVTDPADLVCAINPGKY